MEWTPETHPDSLNWGVPLNEPPPPPEVAASRERVNVETSSFLLQGYDLPIDEIVPRLRRLDEPN